MVSGKYTFLLIAALCLSAVWNWELLSTPIVLVMTFISLLSYRYFEIKEKKLRNIPGPDGWPIIGNLLQLPKGNPCIEFKHLAEKFGPVFRLNVGTNYMVVVNDFDTIQEVLVKKGKDFAGRPYQWRSNYGLGGQYSISRSDPSDLWQAGRKLVHKSLKTFGSGLMRIERLALEITDEMVHTFLQSKGKPMDPEAAIYCATIQMTSLLVLGEKLDENSISYQNVKVADQEIVQGFCDDFSGTALDAFPWVRYFGNKTFKQLIENFENLWKNEVLNKLQKWDLDKKQDEKSLPVAQALFAFEKQNQKVSVRIPDKFKKWACFDLILGGVLTTSSSMLSLFLIIVHHPDVQQRIQEEIRTVLGDKQVGLEHQTSLPYTQATIYELHRYVSIVGTNAPHKALKDTFILNYAIPKGTMVLTNLWALHHDEKFWGDPFKFRPERFLTEDRQPLPADDPHRKHLLSFSAGPRICIGENLAQARIFLWLVSILQRFTLKPEGDRPTVSCDSRDYLLFSLLRPKPYKIRFLPRKKREQLSV